MVSREVLAVSIGKSNPIFLEKGLVKLSTYAQSEILISVISLDNAMESVRIKSK